MSRVPARSYSTIYLCFSLLACSPVSRVIAPYEEDASAGQADASSSEQAQTASAANEQGGNSNANGNGSKSSSSENMLDGGASSSSGGSGSSSASSGSSGARSGSSSSGTSGGSKPSNAGSGGDADRGSSGQDADGSKCLPTELACNGKCVPNDTRNCGECGHDCTRLPNVSGFVTCSPEGKCEFDASACAAGWANCSMDRESGCDTDIKTAEHCGDCDTACSAGTPICAGPDGCVSGCPEASPALCGQACVDVMKDAKNCGECGMQCRTTVARAESVCRDGACDFQCNNGLMACGDECIDVMTDNENCGGCDKACTGGKMCSAGACVCPKGTHDCDGKCSDDNALATCGKECSPCRTDVSGAQPVCKTAQCSYMCPSSTKDCDSACVDTNSDNNNCGTCGNRCSGGKTCSSGRCQCSFGTNDCGGKCTDSVSRDACGPLCLKCPNPTSGSGVATCNGISCDISCNGGTKCGTACVDTNRDTKNCGGCNQVCKAGQICTSDGCSCPVDSHLCPNGCRSDWELSSCGDRCDPCPASTNNLGSATCTNTTGRYLCGLSCPEGAPVECSGSCLSFCGEF